MKFPDLTYVTTCKGRLHHLKQSLPGIVAQGLKNIIVVDFDCPDGAADWVKLNFPEVQVIKVENQPKFLHSRANNIGGIAANTQWISFFDADAVLDSRFFEKVSQTLSPGSYYVPNNPDGNTWGSCIVEKSSFQLAGGYDEAVGHWGGVDMAFFNLLNFVGITPAKYDGNLISAIPHDDAHRTRFTMEKSVAFAKQLSTAYEICKLDIMRIQGQLLSLEMRLSLRSAVKAALEQSLALKSDSAQFVVALDDKTQSRPTLGVENTPVVKRTLGFKIAVGTVSKRP